jgi:DNA-binding winged helix-turn-helix (wHTH) protein/TolB-like protein
VTSPRYRFGLFEFDASTLELRRDGKLIRLQSQPAQLLACLLDRAGDTVSREDLRAAIWGSDTFVDFDRGLNFCIAQVRSALDDDTVSPRFIRTFPRRGYQFIAPVERIDERIEPSSESPLEMAQPVQASRKFSTTTLLMACAATALIILSAGSAYIVAARHVSKSRPIVAILRFDNETSDPSIKTFSDAVTDTLVEQLTARSVGHYEVIGNAQILRLPRDQWDLSAIATSLHAEYVVLGQVQSSADKTRTYRYIHRRSPRSTIRRRPENRLGFFSARRRRFHRPPPTSVWKALIRCHISPNIFLACQRCN